MLIFTSGLLPKNFKKKTNTKDLKSKIVCDFFSLKKISGITCHTIHVFCLKTIVLSKIDL